MCPPQEVSSGKNVFLQIPPPPPPLLKDNGCAPPPPPFSTPRAPPPVPNPPMFGINLQIAPKASETKIPIKKNKKTVKLFWKEVRDDPVCMVKLKGGYIWDELNPVAVDTQKLEHLFESRAKDLITKVNFILLITTICSLEISLLGIFHWNLCFGIFQWYFPFWEKFRIFGVGYSH